MPWEIPKNISLLALAILFLFTYFNLILDAPRTFPCTYNAVQYRLRGIWCGEKADTKSVYLFSSNRFFTFRIKIVLFQFFTDSRETTHTYVGFLQPVFTTTLLATTVEVQVVALAGVVLLVPFPPAPDAWLKINILQWTFFKQAETASICTCCRSRRINIHRE
jgi:hypothetical protein